MKDHSQFGESKLIADAIAVMDRNGFSIPLVAVEFGAGDGFELSNIRGLMENGWAGIQLDNNPRGGEVISRTVIPENIDLIIPVPCGVLSIDVDGNDYWLWEALISNPWIVIIEFNQTVVGRKAISYNPNHRWAGDDYFGASFQAMIDLGRSKGYKAIAKTLCNLIFIRADVWPDQEPELTHVPDQSGWTISGRKFKKV